MQANMAIDAEKKPVDILDACEQAFDLAYSQHMAGGNYVTLIGDSEFMKLQAEEGEYQTFLRRPHLKAVISKGAAFLINHTANTGECTIYAATEGDSERLYSTDWEDDPLDPISPEKTAEIARLIAAAKIVPLLPD
jgi:hypothetical protein